MDYCMRDEMVYTNYIIWILKNQRLATVRFNFGTAKAQEVRVMAVDALAGM